MLEKVPQGYPSPLQRSISRSYSDDSEWLPSPPASPHPRKTPSLMHAAKNRDAFNFAAPPVSPQSEDTHWAEPLSDAPKLDKRRYTWSPPPEQRSRLSLPVRNRDSLESARAAPPTDPPTSPARRKEIVVQVSIDASLQEAAKPKQRQSEKRRYVCPVGMCVKTFSTSGHASRHAKTHEGRREHVCGECFKRFGRRDNMRQHMTTHAAVLNASGSGSNSNSSSGNIRSSNSKRRKSYGPSCEVTSEGGLAPVLEPSGERQPSAMDLLAAAAAAAEFPAVGDLTLR
jgi:uncharacterized Zn-finger protein